MRRGDDVPHDNHKADCSTRYRRADINGDHSHAGRAHAELPERAMSWSHKVELEARRKHQAAIPQNERWSLDDEASELGAPARSAVLELSADQTRFERVQSILLYSIVVYLLRCILSVRAFVVCNKLLALGGFGIVFPI